MYNSVELFYDPRNIILPKINAPKEEPEMSEFESAFLCGMLRRFKPKKIVEIGIAGGGTTAIILQCMTIVGTEFEMHSIDLSETFYRDKTLMSGYLGQKSKEFLPNVKHEFHLGKLSVEYMDEIGPDIDCFIVDTVHAMPGEYLDFLAWYPMLKHDAIIILHDTALNYTNPDMKIRNSYTDKANCTKILFDSIIADKYFMHDESVPERNFFPNICGFQINEQTADHIANVISSLSSTWDYMPESEQLDLYLQKINLWIDDECKWIMDSVIKINKDILNSPNISNVETNKFLTGYLPRRMAYLAKKGGHPILRFLYGIYKK